MHILQLNELRIWFYREDNSVIRNVSLKIAVSQIKKFLGISLKIESWGKLRSVLAELEGNVRELDSWDSLREQHSFSELKVFLAKKLNYPIKAHSWKTLEEKFLALKSFLQPQLIGARERFEQNKARNFSASSKLEGISIPANISNLSKEEIIAKYLKNIN
ncbi:DUF2559 family protein [Xenorhabdus sp. 12]|uniref:DUF2559 family protein n=1 Tax=Xenorhabdus santafensis TaxID=2582833 RepID=A0ABU4S812_9GAMM|nr:YhfG family protein [Xenorhabdus sp. 12]MDX7986920.1 DUF2559 family protein [Xenorhabdus sp. 12]